MNDVAGGVNEVYWTSRSVLLLAGGVAMLGTQLVLLLWTFRSMGELAHLRERLSRLADGLALLTDTTEAGLSALGDELRQQKRVLRKVERPAADRRDVAARTEPAPVQPDTPTAATADAPAPAPAPAQEPAPAAKRASSRTGVSRRIALAARKGERIAEIAEREALSESEVRLHLALADANAPARAKQKRAS